MLDELKAANKLIGIKQSLKAVQDGAVKKTFIAADADEKVVRKLREICISNAIPVTSVETMKELGKACNIDVGAAVAVILND